MTTIHVHWLGDQALVPKSELERLVELARVTEPIELEAGAEEITTLDMMRLADQAGAFNFWNDPGEDIYSLKDGEPV
jgi:hypothetical protein